MYASIRKYPFHEYLAELVPKLRQNPALIAYDVVDGGEGQLTSISIFDSAWSAHQSNEQVAAWICVTH